MERNRITKLLRATCARIERKFPGTLAEFEDFASPRPAFAGEGYLHVEVFDCKSALKDKLQRFVDRIALDEFCARGLALSVLIWDEDETSKYFREDADHIKRRRSQVETECPTVDTKWQSVGQAAALTRLKKRAVHQREFWSPGWRTLLSADNRTPVVCLLEAVRLSVGRAGQSPLDYKTLEYSVLAEYQTAVVARVRVA